MSLRPLPALLAATALVAVSAFTAAGPAAAAPTASEHQRVVDFWTVDKVKKAKPRDFVYDEATGTFELRAAPAKPAAKPVKPGDGTSVLGADWTGGGLVQEATGKVLFAMGADYYVCSATVTKDSKTDRSIVTTAGHCVYDNASGAFATNWLFVPDYDSAVVALDGAGQFCAQTTYGCWTATALVASRAFTGQTSFNTTATQHDYAFAAMGTGGHSTNASAQLDTTVGAQAISFTAGQQGDPTYLFGYPAAKPFDGTRLIYSAGPLGTDPLNANLTYRVGSTMTGGSSGGPWFQSFNATSGNGTQISVNSYGYSRLKYMHGPVFTDETEGMFDQALIATGNVG